MISSSPHTIIDSSIEVENKYSTSIFRTALSNSLVISIKNVQESTTIKNDSIIIKEKTSKTKEEIKDNLNEFIKDYDINKIYEIIGDNYNITISPIDNNEYKSMST